jgi:hypothetical protein
MAQAHCTIVTPSSSARGQSRRAQAEQMFSALPTTRTSRHQGSMSEMGQIPDLGLAYEILVTDRS